MDKAVTCLCMYLLQQPGHALGWSHGLRAPAACHGSKECQLCMLSTAGGRMSKLLKKAHQLPDLEDQQLALDPHTTGLPTLLLFVLQPLHAGDLDLGG